MEFVFSDIFDVAELRKVLEAFTALTGAVTAVLDREGVVHVATGWKKICTQFHRVHPCTAARCRVSDTVLAARLKAGESYNVYCCRNGLVDVAVPLVVEGVHVGNVFTGQFLFEKPDVEIFRNQAREFGFDEKEYLDALEKVPVFSEEQVRKTMAYLVAQTELIGKMGLAKLKLLQMNSELEEARQKAEQADRMKSVFVANISHEIRTPMNAIVGFSEMLIVSRGSHSQEEKYVEIINENCDQLLKIIDDVLDLSRLEVGQIVIEKRPTSVPDLLERCLEAHAAVGKRKGLNFVFRVEGGRKSFPRVAIDAARVKQIADNLIGNAVKYTDKGEISVVCELVDDEVVITVTDTGIGIPTDYLNSVFERFSRVENSRKDIRGTGLGLAISKSLVELMGGRIWVESEPGRGSRFAFSVPTNMGAGEFASPMPRLQCVN